MAEFNKQIGIGASILRLYTLSTLSIMMPEYFLNKTSNQLIAKQWVLYGVCGIFSHCSNPCFPRWWGLVNNRPEKHPCLCSCFGDLSYYSPFWILCKAVVSKYFQIVSSGTLNIVSCPPILCYSELFEGTGGLGSSCLGTVVVPFHIMKTGMVNLVHCFCLCSICRGWSLSRKRRRAEVSVNIK